MATIRPFRAVRPVAELCEAVASVPYDVVSVSEARALSVGNPHSFLHVIRPEIDLAEGTDEHDDSVYAQGAENLRHYVDSSSSVQEASPVLYVYRLAIDSHEQSGLYGCVSVAEYDNNIILKHENTRPAKVKDRVRHILAQQAHAEPVNITYRDNADVTRLVKDIKRGAPLYDFVAKDGVRHTVWKADAPQLLVEAFQSVSHLYVADGHHRCQAASEAFQISGHPSAAFFPAVLFPMDEMHIMPYNRIILKSPLGDAALLDAISQRCSLEKDVSEAAPGTPGRVCLYTAGRWHRITLPATQRDSVADELDIARLSEHVLEPVFGIMDQRSDPNIIFVGGIRGTEELQRRVDAGHGDVAFSMAATSIEELVDVSDAGLLMPPKSTWFEPKLRSGLLVHMFD